MFKKREHPKSPKSSRPKLSYNFWFSTKLIFLSFLLSGCFSGFYRNCPNTLNVYWSKLPATIRNENLNSQEVLYFQNAIDNWNTTLGKEYIRLDNNSYNIIMNGGSSFRPTEQGVTKVKTRGMNIARANIYINPALIGRTDLESLYIHELGHFIGLDHIPDTVMDMYLEEYFIRIDIDKVVINAVQCLYRK